MVHSIQVSLQPSPSVLPPNPDAEPFDPVPQQYRLQLHLRLLRLRQLPRPQRSLQRLRPPRHLQHLPIPARPPAKSPLGHAAGLWHLGILETNANAGRGGRNDDA